MSLIKWDEKYSVNIEEIDNQHKELITLINKLHEAMKARQGKEKVGEIIEGLLEYTKYHFSAEENIMKANTYPSVTSHMKEHTDFIREASLLHQKFSQGGDITLPMDTMNFLQSWLINHIQKSDKQYAEYFSKNNVTV